MEFSRIFNNATIESMRSNYYEKVEMTPEMESIIWNAIRFPEEKLTIKIPSDKYECMCCGNYDSHVEDDMCDECFEKYERECGVHHSPEKEKYDDYICKCDDDGVLRCGCIDVCRCCMGMW